MNTSVSDEQPCSYEAVTLLTASRMESLRQEAVACPRSALTLEKEASKAFWQWADATRDAPHPDIQQARQQDFCRFKKHLREIKALHPQQEAGVTDAADVAVLTAALRAVVYRLDVRRSCGEATHLDILALDQARAALCGRENETSC